MKFKKLIKEGVIVKQGDTYKCKCGSVLKEKSVYSHMRTKKHRKYMEEEVFVVSIDCGICTMPKSDFYRCEVCKNTHCLECHSHMNKCPYCRTNYAPEPAPLNELEWYWAEQDQSHLM